MPQITCDQCGRIGHANVVPPPSVVLVCENCTTPQMRDTMPTLLVEPDDKNQD